MSGNDNFTKFLFQSEDADGSTTFTDYSVGGVDSQHIITRYGLDEKHSTDQAKFGLSSFSTADGAPSAGVGFEVNTDSNDFDILAQDFALDIWVRTYDYANNLNNGSYVAWIGPLALRISSLGPPVQIEAQTYDNSSNHVILHGDLSNPDSWNHIAFSRSGNTFRLFINGTLVATDSTTITGALHSNHLKASVFRGSNNFYGYGEECRLSVGTDRGYTANFTPPTEPYSAETSGNEIAPSPHVTGSAVCFPDHRIFPSDQYDNGFILQSVHAVDGSTTFTDTGKYSRTLTPGHTDVHHHNDVDQREPGAAGPLARLGTSYIDFTSTNKDNHIEVDNWIYWGQNNATVDFFVNFTSKQAVYLFSSGLGGNREFYLHYNGTDGWELKWYQYNGYHTLTFTQSPSLGEWVHIAIVRTLVDSHNDIFSIYYNGARVATTTIDYGNFWEVDNGGSNLQICGDEDVNDANHNPCFRLDELTYLVGDRLHFKTEASLTSFDVPKLPYGTGESGDYHSPLPVISGGSLAHNSGSYTSPFPTINEGHLNDVTLGSTGDFNVPRIEVSVRRGLQAKEIIPGPEITGSANVGISCRGDYQVKASRVSGYFAGKIKYTAPSASVSGHAKVMRIGTGDFLLPPPSFAATGAAENIAIGSYGVRPVIIAGEISLPTASKGKYLVMAPVISASVMETFTGEGAFTTPMCKVSSGTGKVKNLSVDYMIPIASMAATSPPGDVNRILQNIRGEIR